MKAYTFSVFERDNKRETTEISKRLLKPLIKKNKQILLFGETNDYFPFAKFESLDR